MEDFLSREHLLWNIDRTKRIELYWKTGQSHFYNGQCKMLTAMQAADLALANFSVDAARSILAQSDNVFESANCGLVPHGDINAACLIRDRTP